MAVAAFRISTRVNAEPIALYDFLKDIEQFSKLTPQIRKSQIISRLDQNRQISMWEVEVEGTIFCWKEEDEYCDDRLSWAFRAIDGDFQSFRGLWVVKRLGSISQLTIESFFDWGIPRLGQYAGPVLESKAKRNLVRMLAALRKKFSQVKGF